MIKASRLFSEDIKETLANSFEALEEEQIETIKMVLKKEKEVLVKFLISLKDSEDLSYGELKWKIDNLHLSKIWQEEFEDSKNIIEELAKILKSLELEYELW